MVRASLHPARLLIGLSIVAACSALAACGSSTSTASGGGSSRSTSKTTAASAGTGSGGCTSSGPIKIGGIGGLTGAVPVPEGTQAATAYFNQLNAQGGLCGQKVQYTVIDDKGDPATTAAASRQLIEQDDVVGMVSESFLNCTVDKAYYAQNPIAITGVTPDVGCFQIPDASMTNSGPGVGILGELYYASQVLKKSPVCAILLNIPGYGGVFKHAADLFTQETGKKLALYDNTASPTSDPTQYAIKAKQAGCKAVVTVDPAPVMGAWLKALAAEGASNIITFGPSALFLPSFPQTLPASDNGLVYTAPELEPSTTNPAVANALATIKKSGAAMVDNTSLGGWLGAEVLTQAIKSIHGSVTRASVLAAMQRMTSYANPFMGTPYSFGTAKTHLSNQALKFAVADGGKWKIVTNNWIKIPGAAQVYSVQ